MVHTCAPLVFDRLQGLVARCLAGHASFAQYSRDADPEDRALLRDVWLHGAANFDRPWYATRALLLLASKAGSAGLIPKLVEQLSSSDAEAQRLAIDALAAISGLDLRRDATGKRRTLSELVGEYRRECGP